MPRTSLGACAVAALLLASPAFAGYVGEPHVAAASESIPNLFIPAVVVTTMDTNEADAAPAEEPELIAFAPVAETPALLENPATLVHLADWAHSIAVFDAAVATLGEAASIGFLGF